MATCFNGVGHTDMENSNMENTETQDMDNISEDASPR